jgi:hypothetical protein|tara:strand:+ start:1106 stop:1315 length:210 start_codon:yes stop_codon:yes gene_type:complete
MDLVKIKNESEYMRDLNSGAIVNTNTIDIEKRRNLKLKKRQEKIEFENLKVEVNDIKKMLIEISRKLGD